MAPSTLEQFIRFGTDAGEFPPFYFTVPNINGFLAPFWVQVIRNRHLSACYRC